MTAQDLLVEMFDRMVVRKDATLTEHYYHPDFLLTTNGTTQDYASFARGHRTVYATAIGYAVRYDDDAWVSTEDRVAGRLWITTSRPGEDPTEIEVVLVATVLDGRIHRMWELTWPDWSALQAFEDYDGSTS
jgi:hypothetical protein